MKHTFKLKNGKILILDFTHKKNRKSCIVMIEKIITREAKELRKEYPEFTLMGLKDMFANYYYDILNFKDLKYVREWCKNDIKEIKGAN